MPFILEHNQISSGASRKVLSTWCPEKIISLCMVSVGKCCFEWYGIRLRKRWRLGLAWERQQLMPHTEKRRGGDLKIKREREGDRSQSHYSQGDLWNLAIPSFTYFITEVPLRSIWNNVGKWLGIVLASRNHMLNVHIDSINYNCVSFYYDCSY